MRRFVTSVLLVLVSCSDSAPTNERADDDAGSSADGSVDGGADGVSPEGSADGGSAVPYFTGAVRVVVSGSRDDVQNAIDAAADLDIVKLPASCSATWTSMVTFTKAIKLDLNGCTITRNIANSDPLVSFSPPAGKRARVTNGAMNGGSTGTGFKGRYVEARDEGTHTGRFRIDHLQFGSASGSINVRIGDVLGVTDHCAFADSSPNEFIHVEAWGPGDAAGWSDDVVPGSEPMVFTEDNTFAWTAGTSAGANAAIQHYYGARAVFRHNTVSDAVVDVHGNTPRKGRWIEIYENDWYRDVNLSKTVQLRGGSGVIFGNRLHNKAGAGGSATCELWIEEGGAYPILDQPGRGKDQTLEPVHIWSNQALDEGGGSGGFVVGISEATNGSIQLGRDYELSPRSGYVPFTYPHPLQLGTE